MNVHLAPKTTCAAEGLPRRRFTVAEVEDTSFWTAALYASFGVLELWVIDAVRLKLSVFRQPSDAGFGETRILPVRTWRNRPSLRIALR